MTEWFFERGVTEQTKSFMDGFNDVMPLKWLQYFDEREFEVRAVFILCLLRLETELFTQSIGVTLLIAAYCNITFFFC